MRSKFPKGQTFAEMMLNVKLPTCTPAFSRFIRKHRTEIVSGLMDRAEGLVHSRPLPEFTVPDAKTRHAGLLVNGMLMLAHVMNDESLFLEETMAGLSKRFQSMADEAMMTAAEVAEAHPTLRDIFIAEYGAKLRVVGLVPPSASNSSPNLDTQPGRSAGG